jgi:hypothetical protein
MLGDLIKSMIGPIISPLIDRIPDPNERARAKEQIEVQMLAAMTSLVQGQIETNKEQAKHSSVFVAGARPFIMWVCGVALLWQFFLEPMATWGLVAFAQPDTLPPFPKLDIGPLMTLLLGMLGLGGLRTYEKRLGVERNFIRGNKDGG